MVVPEYNLPDNQRHAPEITNNNGQTVAMRFALTRQLPCEKWQHDPTLRDNDGNTVAMLCAKVNI